MPDFQRAVIIYNPNSTGDSPEMAKEFAAELGELYPKVKVALQETERAGHAEELTYTATAKPAKSLIVSVSGDGGYHEVINGAMRAVDEGYEAPLCAVLPGGNANDHYSNVYDRPLLEALKASKTTKLDLLEVSWEDKKRYAHSYVGLGITPLVAIELNKHSLSALKEMWLAFKTFWKFRPFKISIDGSVQSFDSFIMANISSMAKHLTLDEASSPRDGSFEVVRWPHGHKLRLIARLILSALGKGRVQDTTSQLEFETLNAMPMQLDGEIVKLPPKTKVQVRCAHAKLQTFR